MKVLITGASSGIGRDMAIYLNKLGHEVIIVGSNKEKLEKVSNKLNCKSIVMDLSNKDNCIKLYDKVKNENIDILINNAGFGKFGEFTETKLDDELSMINVNINAVHILTKLFLNIFLIAYSAQYSLLIDFISNLTLATLLKLVLTGPGHSTETCTLLLFLLNSSYIDVVSLKTYALVE